MPKPASTKLCGTSASAWHVDAASALVATFAVLVALAALFSPAASAQGDDAEDAPDQVVVFVLDLSGSMNEPFDDARSKLDVAKAAFVEAFTNVSPEALVGLRVYGDQFPATTPAEREQNCTADSRLVVPVSTLERERLISEVRNFDAVGDTAIGLALRQANSDIPAGALGTVVLFSDGRDECFDADLDGDAASGPSFGEDPCAVARDIAGDGADLKIDRVITVGFRADAAAEAELRCIANSTGGSYTPIETPEDARDVLPELLAELSSPREAERLGGQAIVGTPDRTDAPELIRLDAPAAGSGLYTDTIELNSEKWYHVSEFGPDGGTFTATVFGLPAQEGIKFGMRFFLPESDATFFAENGDDNAGLPRRPTASIRCTECSVTGGPYDGYWIVSLTTTNKDLAGTFELELVTDGLGFGGNSTSCDEPQECWYPQEILERTEALAEMRSQVEEARAAMAPPELLDERAQLETVVAAAQGANDEAKARTEEFEVQIASAPPKGSSIKLPMLLVLIGLILAFLPVSRLRDREKKPKQTEEPAGDEQATNGDDEAPAEPKKRKSKLGRKKKDPASADHSQRVEPADPALPTTEPVPQQFAVPTAFAQPAPERMTATQSTSEPERDAPRSPSTALVPVVVSPEPGWYQDPLDAGRFRRWDGERWTHDSATDQHGGD